MRREYEFRSINTAQTRATDYAKESASVMAFRVHELMLLCILILVSSASHCKAEHGALKPADYDTVSLNRSSFPDGFLFGTASAAYQVDSDSVVATFFSSPFLYLGETESIYAYCVVIFSTEHYKNGHIVSLFAYLFGLFLVPFVFAV